MGGEELKLWTREYRLGRWNLRVERDDGKAEERVCQARASFRQMRNFWLL